MRLPQKMLWQRRDELPPGLRTLRTGQLHFLDLVERYRISAFLTRRQYGKTTTAAVVALRKMIRTPGHTVVFGSLKLDLAREIVRKQVDILQKEINAAFALAADAAGVKVQLYDDKVGKALPADLSPDDFLDLYEHSRLEFRLYHTSTQFSRTKVVALTASAVGETGDLILDEVGRIRDFQAVWEAVKPIISSNRAFRCFLTTTPPPDDRHFSWELLAPPIGMEFPMRPEGNLYKSLLGVNVLRVSADDADLDGVKLFDDETGEPITPAEARAKDPDKDAWDRNFAVKFTTGGSGAVSLLSLNSAQVRGAISCRFVFVETDAQFEEALAWLSASLGSEPVGVGFDVATTEGGTSNPSSVTVSQQSGPGADARIILAWKTKDPAVAEGRVTAILESICRREAGGRPRKLCIDGSNERYFAETISQKLARICPVEVVLGGGAAPEQVTREGKLNMKTYLGSLLCSVLEANHLTLPAHRYITDDFKLVRREGGLFVCDVAPDGKHGDTFDSTKLSLYALSSGGEAHSVRLPQARAKRSRSGL